MPPAPFHRLRAAVLLLALGVAGAAAAQTEVTGFGSNPGNLRMFKYVPAGLPAGAPLVVALHGCAQSASSYDAETGWVLLADRWRFALLLPQQQSANNSSSCFNWFEVGDTTRGQGEPLSIRQMVDRMIADHGSAAGRIYVTGLSAGGAMTAVMLATYPDVFAGGAVVAGLPYRCATSQSAAFSCMNPGTDLTPAQWGDRVRAAFSYAGPRPIVSLWHGASPRPRPAAPCPGASRCRPRPATTSALRASTSCSTAPCSAATPVRRMRSHGIRPPRPMARTRCRRARSTSPTTRGPRRRSA